MIDNEQNFQADSPYTETIKRLFGKRTDEEVELVWNLVSLLIYQGAAYSEIPYLYEKLGINDFLIVCQVLGGQQIRLPTRKEVEEKMLTALLYYEREILCLDWADIKQKYPELEINSMRYAIQIKKLDNFVKLRIRDIMKDIGERRNEFNGFMSEIKPDQTEVQKDE